MGTELERGKGRWPGDALIRLLTRGVGRPMVAYGAAAGRMGGGGTASGGRRRSLRWAGLGRSMPRARPATKKPRKNETGYKNCLAQK
jgi:hypothetical protein